MKICAVQTKPVKGDTSTNISSHIKLIELAVANGADIIIFPELSITGYEPTLAAALATDKDDSRFNVFQNISDARLVTIGIGAPTKNDTGTCISMVIFQPQKAMQLYSKKYLHADEEPFFISGQNAANLAISQANIAFAICYEISIPAHAANAVNNGAAIYIASVAKSITGVAKACETLSAIAHKYSITVLMANCVGHCDDFDCGGKTSAWNSTGMLTGQLNGTGEGMLIVDTNTENVLQVFTE